MKVTMLYAIYISNWLTTRIDNTQADLHSLKQYIMMRNAGHLKGNEYKYKKKSRKGHGRNNIMAHRVFFSHFLGLSFSILSFYWSFSSFSVYFIHFALFLPSFFFLVFYCCFSSFFYFNFQFHISLLLSHQLEIDPKLL